MQKMYRFVFSDSLMHHGIQGQKWGVRNGPPYPLDRELHVTSSDRVFISGSSKLQNKKDNFYRREIPSTIRKNIDRICSANATVLVGDAPGFDTMVQDYLAKKRYHKVHIYVTGNDVRKNADSDGTLGWTVHNIDGRGYEEGSQEWHAEKDKAMTKDSTQSFAVVIENGASATRRNIKRAMECNKNTLTFEVSSKGSKYDRYIDLDSD